MLTALLRRMGYERKARPFAQFLSFKETIKAAKAAGLSVGEYLERRHMTGSRTARDLTMDGMADVIRLLKEENIREEFVVMVGGGPISQGFADRIGADGYARDASEAARLAQRLVQRVTV